MKYNKSGSVGPELKSNHIINDKRPSTKLKIILPLTVIFACFSQAYSQHLATGNPVMSVGAALSPLLVGGLIVALFQIGSRYRNTVSRIKIFIGCQLIFGLGGFWSIAAIPPQVSQSSVLIDPEEFIKEHGYHLEKAVEIQEGKTIPFYTNQGLMSKDDIYLVEHDMDRFLTSDDQSRDACQGYLVLGNFERKNSSVDIKLFKHGHSENYVACSARYITSGETTPFISLVKNTGNAAFFVNRAGQ